MRNKLLIAGLVLVAGFGIASLASAETIIECRGGATDSSVGLWGYHMLSSGPRRGLYREANGQSGLQSTERHCVDTETLESWVAYDADTKILSFP